MTLAVLIPVHAEPVEYLRRCINSVLMQPVTGIEIFVVMTGEEATVRARAYLEGLAQDHPQVSLSVHEKRLSASEARNLLIDQVTALGHKTLAFLDADDEWLPNHLTQYQVAIGGRGQGSSLYTAPYVQRQSQRRVTPNGDSPSIWSLTRQPLLLSSMIMTNIPNDLRFRGGGAEDLVFYADCLKALDHFVAGSEQSVIYDLGNWKKKTVAWKLKRSYRAYMTIFDNHLKAAFFVGLFSAHYLWRRVVG